MIDKNSLLSTKKFFEHFLMTLGVVYLLTHIAPFIFDSNTELFGGLIGQLFFALVMTVIKYVLPSQNKALKELNTSKS